MADKKSKKSVASKGESSTAQPKASRPASDKAPEKKPEPQDPANYFVPAVLGLAVVGAIGYWAKSSSAPPEPTAVRPSSDDTQRPSAGQGSGAAVRPSEPPSPAPEPAPPGAGDPLPNNHPSPTTPDPRRGQFSLADATEGMPAGTTLVAEIDTNHGIFTCQLFPERAPNTVANFVGLARGKRDFWDPVTGQWVRRPYYDGTIFHRVIPRFMAQGGDILRSGSGGPGYTFNDENTAAHDQPGMLCMANRGPNTNGSQFFILEEPKEHLNGSYSVFGQCSPVDLVRRITGVPRAPNDRPNSPVVIRTIRVRR
ncbi:MAG: peptidylprolyl isomerase [Myxococcales bacterium]|nr:peptidylprolyl isomerase [Myxococcales bacterium]